MTEKVTVDLVESNGRHCQCVINITCSWLPGDQDELNYEYRIPFTKCTGTNAQRQTSWSSVVTLYLRIDCFTNVYSAPLSTPFQAVILSSHSFCFPRSWESFLPLCLSILGYQLSYHVSNFCLFMVAINPVWLEFYPVSIYECSFLPKWPFVKVSWAVMILHSWGLTETWGKAVITYWYVCSPLSCHQYQTVLLVNCVCVSGTLL